MAGAAGARWLPWIYCCTAGAVAPPLPVCQRPAPVWKWKTGNVWSFYTLSLQKHTRRLKAPRERTTCTAVCPSYPGMLKSAPARLQISRPSRSPLAARLRHNTHSSQLTFYLTCNISPSPPKKKIQLQDPIKQIYKEKNIQLFAFYAFVCQIYIFSKVKL